MGMAIGRSIEAETDMGLEARELRPVAEREQSGRLF